jgi:pSer/pThr/pTyr-binding forkhead associated (FHA) protein
MSFGSTTWSCSTNRVAFRVILRDVDGFEGFSSRQFDLALNAKFPIGRASKNTAKQDLMPASNNAYIDSPVISRNHAVFTAHADSGTPQVFVTDLGSMHGTMVNGERLPTHMPKQLASGDKLQFGIDVNRNEGTQPTVPSLSSTTRNSADLPSPSEFFVARKYEFEARLDREPVPFSMGFTVPDSDGEDIDGTTPRRGSQYNPLTIDDSDSESEASDSEQPDTTMMGEDFIVADDDDDEEPPTVTDIYSMRETISGAVEDAAFANQLYLDVTGGVGYSSSDDQDDDIEDFNTEASVMGDSMAAYDSDFDGRSFEPEASPISAERLTEKRAATTLAPMQSQAPTHSSFSSQSRFDASSGLEELPGINAPQQGFESVFTHSYPPALPPRPAAEPSNRPPWHSAEYPAYPAYLDTSADRPAPFSPLQVSLSGVPLNAADLVGEDNSANNVPSSDRIQTPPSMQQSDTTTVSTPPPNRRTKVSIGEIVEDQPPTPESLNGMKRKADVLEEVEEIAAPTISSLPEHLLTAEVSLPVSGTADRDIAETAAIIASRPKKQPRSILRKINTTAKYLGIGAAGAAGALAVLSALPDAFFV